MRRIKVLLALLCCAAGLLVGAQAAPAASINYGQGSTMISHACNVGYGESVSGVHLWVCSELWASWPTGSDHHVWPVGRVYCYLNGNNNSQVACSSFNGLVFIGPPGGGAYQFGPNTTCGQGSPNGPCSANGITVTPNWYYGASGTCQGTDFNLPHYGTSQPVTPWEPGVDGSAYINGTIHLSIGQWWGASNQLCWPS